MGYNVATTQRATYAEIRQLLEGLASRFGWQPIMEGDLIIGVQMDGQSVTLEPGGQFELSGAPVDTLHKTCAEVNQHLYQVQAPCSLAEGLGVRGRAGGHAAQDLHGSQPAPVPGAGLLLTACGVRD